MTRNFEKRDFKRWFFYMDVLVLGVFALALVMLVRDAYAAGFYEAVAATDFYGTHFWAMVRDVAFLVAALSWIFYRYFKTTVRTLADPWT
ncbi:MAG TPA: hypothetical protein VM681_02695 [Candidatus Thermoplasmatota archaeon]|nr:hypothetical protein [Candidatus Thermoplasmatota archaeon]